MSKRKIEQLTPRLRATFELVNEGWTNTEIADILTITRRAAKARVSTLLRIFEARDRIELVVIGWKSKVRTAPR